MSSNQLKKSNPDNQKKRKHAKCGQITSWSLDSTWEMEFKALTLVASHMKMKGVFLATRNYEAEENLWEMLTFYNWQECYKCYSEFSPLRLLLSWAISSSKSPSLHSSLVNGNFHFVSWCRLVNHSSYSVTVWRTSLKIDVTNYFSNTYSKSCIS